MITVIFRVRRCRRAHRRGDRCRGAAAQTQTPADDALIKKAQGIHERVMTLDTHDDINADELHAERNYTQDLGNQVNLPKMVKGGLDAAFFIVYVGQGTADAPKATTAPTSRRSRSSTPSTG